MQIDFATKEDLQSLETKLTQIIDLLSGVKPEEPKEWLKSSDVRRILKCSDSTLKNYRDAGKLPFSKVQGTYFYKSADVEMMLAANH